MERASLLDLPNLSEKRLQHLKQPDLQLALQL